MCWQGFARFKYISPAALLLVMIFTPGQVRAQQTDPLSVEVGQISGVQLGSEVHLPLLFHSESADLRFGGFDLLLSYDTAGLTLVDVAPGNLLAECNWDHFHFVNLSAGLVRLVGISDFPDSAGTPSCHFEGPRDDTLALLTFAVTSDLAYHCAGFFCEFYWAECFDNVFSCAVGDTLFISASVERSFWGEVYVEDTLPSFNGVPDSCIAELPFLELRAVNYIGGYVETTCLPDVVEPGDMNLNGIPFEIADWAGLEYYFFYGLGFLDLNTELQIAASEVNNDGVPLTMRDLAFMWRVIVGDALPDPAPVTDESPDTAVFVQDTDVHEISFTHPDSMAIIFLAFDGSAVPQSASSSLSLTHYTVNGVTRVMVQFYHPAINGGIHSGPLISYTGDAELITAEVANWQDDIIRARIEVTGGKTTCGDADGNSVVNISDVVFLVQYIFNGGPAPTPASHGDANCDELTNISDAVYLLNYIFSASHSPCNSCP